MVEPRLPQPTVDFVDEYCEAYKHLLTSVRSFEAFKHLHIGMISDIKRKSLPAIAKIAGIGSEQSLHHFITESPWQVLDLKSQRLNIILKILQCRKIKLITDETGYNKK